LGIVTSTAPLSPPDTVQDALLEGLDRWRELPAAQQPEWPASDALAAATAELATYPPLVFAGECDELKTKVAAAARGEAFFLQGGDCAETFADATADRIRNKIKTLLQMAVVLTYGASMPVIKVGRMAGQFSKPRSKPTEIRDGVELPAYRGDAVNDYAFDPVARIPDPRRLLRAYHTSSATLNLVRAFTKGGFADLRHVHEWNRGFVATSANARYEALARDIDRAMRFMAAAGADFDALRTVDLYSSHEGLILDYERPLTRIDSRIGLPYNVSAHFVWVGERTRQLGGAHVDLMSRVRNPVGVKLGPNTTPEDALAIIDKLNPDDEPGRLTLVSRMGGQGPDLVAAAGRGRLEGRPERAVDLRPHARQHVRGGVGLQDPPFRRRPRRGAGLLRGARGPRDGAGRPAHRAHRGRRHRVPRRCRGDRRG